MSVEALITEHLDTWTGAIQRRNATGRGSNKKIELYGVKKLRELILELAVRGRLVPQDAGDEPAEVLLERIAVEKARLVKEKKIKKPKALPPVSEDEKPFEVPVGWAWCRVQDVGHDWGQTKPSDSFTYIDVASINKELGFIDNPTELPAEEAPSRARKIVKKGTVIYSTVRPYLLNIAVIGEDYSLEPIASTAFAVVHPYSDVSSSFIYRYLRSPSFVGYVEQCQTGIAYPAINDKQFFSGVFPLPPEAEQNRIATKVNELMQLCDQLEQATETNLAAHETLVSCLLETLTQSRNAEGLAGNWNILSQHFDTLFTTEASIDQLKQTILQLAVMGKLVPQDPNDEPAEVLLERIAAEKARLVKEKKIKKQKVLPEITEEEKPFELPEGWAWCRLQDIAIVGTGATPSRANPEYWSSKDVSWVSSGETAEPFINETKEKVSLLATQETNVSVYPVGTLIIAMYGQGKTRGQITELNVEAGTNQACASIQLVSKEVFHRQYVKMFFTKAYDEVRQASAGGAQPNLNVGKIANTVLPCPPLLEEERIISKVGELMAICDQLKTNLTQAQQTQLQLTDTLVEQAL